MKPLDGDDSVKILTNSLTYLQRFAALLQSFVDIKLDPKNRSGFISILQKSLHFENTLIRDALIKLVMLIEDDCNLAMFIKTLTDFRVLLNSMTPQAAELFGSSFACT